MMLAPVLLTFLILPFISGVLWANMLFRRRDRKYNVREISQNQKLKRLGLMALSGLGFVVLFLLLLALWNPTLEFS